MGRSTHKCGSFAKELWEIIQFSRFIKSYVKKAFGFLFSFFSNFLEIICNIHAWGCHSQILGIVGGISMTD